MYDKDGMGTNNKIKLLQILLTAWEPNKNVPEEENIYMLNKCLSLLNSTKYFSSKSQLIQHYKNEVKDHYKEKMIKKLEKICHIIHEAHNRKEHTLLGAFQCLAMETDKFEAHNEQLEYHLSIVDLYSHNYNHCLKDGLL